MNRAWILVLLLALAGHAATPTYNGASVQVTDIDGDNTVTSGTLTASAGSNRLLEVTVGVGAGTPAVHSGVTWGGVALTQRNATLTVGPNGRVSKWFLKEASFPGSATGTVVATFASNQDEAWVAAVIYNDVNQTSPYKNASMTTATGAASNSATITVTSDAATLVTGSVWLLDQGNAASIAITAGTSRQEVDNLASLGFESGGVGDIAGGASNATTSWTLTPAGGTIDDWGMVGDALQYQAGSGSTAPPSGMLLRGGGK
jgi:hypothetical protein